MLEREVAIVLKKTLSSFLETNQICTMNVEKQRKIVTYSVDFSLSGCVTVVELRGFVVPVNYLGVDPVFWRKGRLGSEAQMRRDPPW